MLQRKVIRQEEYDADFDGIRFMAKAGYDLQGSIKVQELLESFSKVSNKHETNWTDALFQTHPSPQERKQVNLQTISTFSQKGIVGKREFESVMKRLKNSEPAYEFIEKGRIALENRHVEKALQFAKRAISIVPNEPVFHGLMAEAMMAQKNHKEALNFLEKAIQFDNNNYSFHLNKGLVLDHLGFTREAWKELTISLSLFPCAEIHYKLGMMAIREKKRSVALEHFYAATKFDTHFAEMAKLELEKLEI